MMHCITPVVKLGPVRLSILSVRVMKKLKFIEIFSCNCVAFSIDLYPGLECNGCRNAGEIVVNTERCQATRRYQTE